MMRFSENVFIGNSDDEKIIDITSEALKINSVLCVAVDMRSTRWHSPIEYAQVGLVDGPGNPASAYCAAILQLAAMIERQDTVLVCCHSGSRSLAVAIMYTVLKEGRKSERVSAPSRWRTWDSVLGDLVAAVDELPTIHEAHREACDKLPFGLLEQLL